MRRNIPSLISLQAFESAARLSSFTKASIELNVTQSAVSRLIRGLEDQLGVDLFSRSKSGVSLTAAGARYLPAVGACLDGIEASTLGIRGDSRDDSVLNLATLPTFGARWLVPRLTDFEKIHPEIRINLSVRTEVIDLAGSNLDAAIFFGTPIKSNLIFERLIGDELIPVCSPALVNGLPTDALHLSDYPLLELAIPDSWKSLFRSAGLPELRGEPSSNYDYFSVGIQSAISGRGILLVPPFLVIDDLRDGRLFVPHAARVSTGLAYHLIYPEAKKALRAVRKFQGWIKQAIRETERDCDRLLAA